MLKRISIITLLSLVLFSHEALASHQCPKPAGQSGTDPGRHYTAENAPEGKSAGDPVPCTLAGQVAEGAGFELGQIFVWAIGAGALMALGVITYAGVMWSASGGSSEKIHDSQDRIKNAIYGLILLLAAYLILNTINPEILKF